MLDEIEKLLENLWNSKENIAWETSFEDFLKKKTLLKVSAKIPAEIADKDIGRVCTEKDFSGEFS